MRQAFDDALRRIGTAAKVYYAGKAFLSVEVARWMAEAGLNIDVCTGGELAVALAAGVDPERLGLPRQQQVRSPRSTGPSRSASARSSSTACRRSSASPRPPTATACVQSVRLRVNSGVHAHTHAFLATAHEDQKFGIALEHAVEAVDRIRSHAVAAPSVGLHCHIGSQIFGADGFAESAARLLDVHASCWPAATCPS